MTAAGAAFGVHQWRLRDARLTWARTAAGLEVSHHVDAQDYEAAFRLAHEAVEVEPGNPVLQQLVTGTSRAVSITSQPSNALVEVKGYWTGAGGWLTLGRTPLPDARVPIGLLRVRVTHEGYEPLETATHWGRPFDFRLVRRDTAPPGMVLVGGAPAGTPAAAPAGEFWIDRFEVSNRDYKTFVDAGGYRTPAYWTEPFVRDGQPISREEALASFVDRTGRPGPATWELATYPDGRGDEPVTGVSWYEAAAYARFAGKSLPTADHWRRAAGMPLSFADILTASNFERAGLAPVGRHRGLSASGTLDMAGNAKEWCWNEAAAGRLVLGGAWNDEPYVFGMPEAFPPFDRQPTIGFRCIRDVGASDPRRRERIPVPAPREVPAVSAEVFAAYRRLFAFDRASVDPRVDAVDDAQPFWRLESVSYVGPDGVERIPALLFLPRQVAPPYQVVVYRPGADASMLRNRRDMSLNWIEPLVRGGRAVLHPIYSGTFERARPRGPLAFRDTVIAATREVVRSVDFVEARRDLDPSRIAFVGLSDGAMHGLIAGAIESRLRTMVLLGAGVPGRASAPEIEPLVYAPRVTRPVLMVNGRADFVLPYDSAQVPLFELLGTPAGDKRHAVFPGGHVPLRRQDLVREVLTWLDARLGPVRSAPVSAPTPASARSSS